MSSSSENLYDASDTEQERKPPKYDDQGREASVERDVKREVEDEIERETGGEQEEQEERDSEQDDSEEGENNNPRICTVCFNLKLFLEPTWAWSDNLDSDGNNTRNVLLEELMRDKIKSKCTVKIEFYELLESARLEECAYCQFLFNCLRTEDAEPDEARSTIIRVLARTDSPFYIYWDDKNRGPRSVEVYTQKDSIPDIPELGRATEIAPRAFADPVFAQIREWLTLCEKEHETCPQKSLSPPRRLVDVGVPTPPKGIRKIRLVQDHLEPVKYIALSHCWGTEQNFTTTKSTLDKRMKEISWNELPKTYRDAVKVARKLHIRYIWIDSLCIIQDDEDDWDIESAKMALIYEESYLTLAASLGVSDSQGFLGLDDDRLEYTSKQVRSMGSSRIRKIHDYRSISSRDVLGKRAWTMQERIIPQRLLTFSVGISFQCRQAEWCECGNTLFPDVMAEDLDTWRRLDRALCRSALDGQGDSTEIYNFWLNGIVVPYSRKKLTKMSDRLPAVSALAQKFQLKLDETYLAGIWQNDLICGLAWLSDTSESEFVHQDMSDRAPSWSWASIEGPIKFGYINEGQGRPRNPNLRLRFLGWSVDPRGFNTTGEVESGTLIASGPYLTCFLTRESQEQHAPYQLFPISQDFGDLTVTRGLWFDCPLEEVTITEESGETVTSLNRSKYDNREAVGGMVICLLLYQLRQDGIYLTRDFLILGRSASGAGTYQRLGILNVSSYESLSWFAELPETSVTIV